MKSYYLTLSFCFFLLLSALAQKDKDVIKLSKLHEKKDFAKIKFYK